MAGRGDASILWMTATAILGAAQVAFVIAFLMILEKEGKEPIPRQS